MPLELRQLPSVDTLLKDEHLMPLVERHGHQLVVEAIRTELEHVRDHILSGQATGAVHNLAQAVVSRIEVSTRPSLQPVINATGVIIHTNLGRALLSSRAQTAMTQAAAAYSNLEYDLAAGGRGSRYVHAADLLCRLTGAEAALVVNNNAAAVVLALTALVKGKEVLISRSQLVEIGGGFRIPDILVQSGAHLVEVGTTNRTYIRDFERALDSERSGLLLSVHYSNYQITGFTTQPSLAELARLAQQHNVLCMEDLGSGTLLDTAPFGLAHEPTIQESLAAGVDLVTASGDKLLGGPQAGIILGKAHLIEQIKKYPLTRALRVDKTTLAALQATLLAYLENKVTEEIPVWQMISAPLNELERRVRKWSKLLRRQPGLSHISFEMIDSFSAVGGGSLPGQTLPTKVLAIAVESPDRLADNLRRLAPLPAVIGRIEADRLLLDPRTVLPQQDQRLVESLTQALHRYNGPIPKGRG